MDLLLLTSVLNWMLYQFFVCKVFIYQTDEIKLRWINAGRVKDKVFDNRLESDASSKVAARKKEEKEEIMKKLEERRKKEEEKKKKEQEEKEKAEK